MEMGGSWTTGPNGPVQKTYSDVDLKAMRLFYESYPTVQRLSLRGK